MLRIEVRVTHPKARYGGSICIDLFELANNRCTEQLMNLVMARFAEAMWPCLEDIIKEKNEHTPIETAARQ